MRHKDDVEKVAGDLAFLDGHGMQSEQLYPVVLRRWCLLQTWYRAPDGVAGAGDVPLWTEQPASGGPTPP